MNSIIKETLGRLPSEVCLLSGVFSHPASRADFEFIITSSVSLSAANHERRMKQSLMPGPLASPQQKEIHNRWILLTPIYPLPGLIYWLS